MDKIKFGVIGLGKIAHTVCSDLIKNNKAMLYAVGSRTIEKATVFAKKFNAEKAYGSYQELIDDKDVEVVYIATPHNFHKEISIKCMNAGKAVLCEKPAGINEDELQQMIDCAKKNKVFFMEAMWTRFFPISQKVKEIVNSGELGEVGHIEADFGYGSWQGENVNDIKDRLYSPHLAGGAILDVGIYPVAYTTWVKEKSPDKIASFAHMTDLGIDGNAAMIFSYNDKCTALLQCSICVNTSADARIYFEKGKIEINRFFMPHYMKITYLDGRTEEVHDDFKNRGYNGYNYEIDHVADCINQGLLQSPIHSWDEALEVIKILDTVRKQVDLVYPFEK